MEKLLLSILIAFIFTGLDSVAKVYAILTMTPITALLILFFGF